MKCGALRAECPRHYGEIRRHLETAGVPIGSMDLLIAAHARAAGLIVVTHNTREFERVPGLVLEDWAVR
jgi:tRNA(fMet)-specific endonuclease VapC